MWPPARIVGTSLALAMQPTIQQEDVMQSQLDGEVHERFRGEAARGVEAVEEVRDVEQAGRGQLLDLRRRRQGVLHRMTQCLDESPSLGCHEALHLPVARTILDLGPREQEHHEPDDGERRQQERGTLSAALRRVQGAGPSGTSFHRRIPRSTPGRFSHSGHGRSHSSDGGRRPGRTRRPIAWG